MTTNEDDDLASWQQLLTTCRERVAAIRDDAQALRKAIDTPIQLDGGGRQLPPRVAGVLTLLSWAGALLGGGATAITAIFTTGLAFQILLGITLVSLAYVAWEFVRSVRLAGPWYRDAVVTSGCLLFANNELYEPGTKLLPGLLLVTFDEQLNGDPEKLCALAAELKEHVRGEGSPPSAMRDAVTHLRTSVTDVPPSTRFRLPRAVAGNDATFIVSLGFEQKAMPNGCIDRDLWPVFGRADKNEAVSLVRHELWG